MKVLQLILLGVFAYRVNADGGYANDCKNLTAVSISDSFALRAYCPATSGTPQCSILDLNDCYGTNDGTLVERSGGQFHNRCYARDCSLNGTELECRCATRPKHNGLRNFTIDTNDLVINDHGTLRCFDHGASTPSDCAERPVYSGSSQTLPVCTWVYAFAVSLVAALVY
ncbi:hypothetical protein F4677DRAFT_458794 [Hypoxylon crocopeplum]|nr:hypothetical protein F4677DRAFT_458794 [Hypoxylon crocopeplum]